MATKKVDKAKSAVPAKAKEKVEKTEVKKKKAEKTAMETNDPDFNFAPLDNDFDEIIHEIEKSIGLSQMDVKANKVTTSTGLLALDLVTSGGLVTGGWYTIFGGEQSCKSTLCSTQMANAITSKIPHLLYFDYEGCVTKDTKIRINGKYVSFESFIPDDLLASPPEAKCVINVILTADTLGKNSVGAALYYGGNQVITKIETDCGAELKGYNHPVLVLNESGGADWKKIEDLQVGDLVLVDPNREGVVSV